MQYSVKLPADYDMGIVRRRVRDRGSAFDQLPGLRFKAFLITERAGAAVFNSYAPFYLWHDTVSASGFLAGERFAGVSESFGRPVVEHWIGMHFQARAGAAPPRSATREDLLVHPEEDLGAVSVREREWPNRCKADDRGLFAAAVALDPYRWQLVRFALWESRVSEVQASASTVYEVLHLSSPELDRVATAS